MRQIRLKLLSLPVLMAVLAACASMGNTLAQDLAWERWEKCRVGGIVLSHITPDGRIWVTYTADHGGALAHEFFLDAESGFRSVCRMPESD